MDTTPQMVLYTASSQLELILIMLKAVLRMSSSWGSRSKTTCIANFRANIISVLQPDMKKNKLHNN